MSEHKAETVALTGALAGKGVMNSQRQPGRSPHGDAMFNAVPLLILPVGLYNLWALFQIMAGKAAMATQTLGAQLMAVPMPMNNSWSISFGDLLILIALFCLFFELIRATSTGKIAIINHSLSMIVFILCLVEFLLIPGYSTSVFFLITMMCLLDVLAGFIVTIITARKDFDFSTSS